MQTYQGFRKGHANVPGFPKKGVVSNIFGLSEEKGRLVLVLIIYNMVQAQASKSEHAKAI